MIDINEDIYFGKYGDIQYGTGDVRTIATQPEIIKQNLIDRIRQQVDDYYINNPAVANLQSLIGRSDDVKIEADAEKMIRNALTVDGFLAPGDFDLVAWKQRHDLYIKLSVVINSGIGMTEKINISYTYNTVTGLHYGN